MDIEYLDEDGSVSVLNEEEQYEPLVLHKVPETRIAPPLMKREKTPYKGVITDKSPHPDDKIFATNEDYCAYKEAYRAKLDLITLEH